MEVCLGKSSKKVDFPLPCLIAGGYSAHQTALRILRAKPCHFVGGYQFQATLQGSMFFFLVYNSCDCKQLAEKNAAFVS
jgi:hypothetical protein